MLTERKLAANRMNACRATGPRSLAGRKKVSQNAIQHGLYAKAVLVAAGESPEAFEELRLAIHEQLQPNNEIGRRLVERLAMILWQFERVTRYETAMMKLASRSANLPPDPDSITGREVDPSFPVSSNAPPWQRLAYLRSCLGSWVPECRSCRELIAILGDETNDANVNVPHISLMLAVSEVLQWPQGTGMELWQAVWHANELAHDKALTGSALRNLFGVLAREVNRDSEDVIRAVQNHLRAQVIQYEAKIASAQHEATRLATELKALREQGVAATLYADDTTLERVIRVEQHLVRQMECTLNLFERLQAKDAKRERRVNVLVTDLLEMRKPALARTTEMGLFRVDEGEAVAMQREEE